MDNRAAPFPPPPKTRIHSVRDMTQIPPGYPLNPVPNPVECHVLLLPVMNSAVVDGQTGTVAGAIASGQRAAEEIFK